MDSNGYRLLLPEGTLDYFDLVDVQENSSEVVIYLEEKNVVPEQYSSQETESKGFYDPVVVQDVPLRDRKSTRLNSSHSGQSRMPSSA